MHNLIKKWGIIMFGLAVSNINAASVSREPETTDLKALTKSVVDCSKIIIETDFDPTKNTVITGEQVLTMLNVLSSLPGDNPLRGELESHGLLHGFDRLIDCSKVISSVVDSYMVLLLSNKFEAKKISTATGIDTLSLDGENNSKVTKLVNDRVKKATNGTITNIVKAEDLMHASLAAFSASYFKSFWSTPFESELTGDFHSADGVKSVTYMKGPMTCGYKKDASGEVVCIPLINGTKFVIYKPSSIGTKAILFDPIMMDGLESREIRLSIPKLNVAANLDLKEILTKAGFDGVSKEFYDGALPLGSFRQSAFLKTTLRGLEAGAVTGAIMVSKIPYVKVDVPHSITLLMPLPDGTHIPLFMGYIGDPTIVGGDSTYSSKVASVTSGGRGSAAARK